MNIGDHKTVPSMTRPGVKYTIFNTTEGYRCTCPAYLNGEGHKCKHIKQHQHLKYKK